MSELGRLEARIASLASELQRMKALERDTRLLSDIEEIKQLKARYWKACDGDIVVGPSHEIEEVVALYTEDGSWSVQPRPDMPQANAHLGGSGHAGLRSYFTMLREKYRFIMHFGMAPIITVIGDSATGHWHFLATMVAFDDPQSLFSGGLYLDDYVRTPQGWRIKNTVVVAGFATTPGGGWR
jgi:hypothetical protein